MTMYQHFVFQHYAFTSSCSCVRIKVEQVEQCLTSHQTQYRSYRGRVFTGQMTQPTVSKHWRKTQD